ncbi:MAG: BrnT family toxin [Pyrinomonadaceae bacterium]
MPSVLAAGDRLRINTAAQKPNDKIRSMKLIFEWDKQKAASNLRRHKVSFNEAEEVFGDPKAETYFDEMHSRDEHRFFTIGMSLASRVLLVVHTENHVEADDVIIRIISCRKATSTERKLYEQE